MPCDAARGQISGLMRHYLYSLPLCSSFNLQTSRHPSDIGRNVVESLDGIELPFGRGLGLHETQPAHDKVARGVHQVIIGLDHLAVTITRVKPELLEPVAKTGEHFQLAR